MRSIGEISNGRAMRRIRGPVLGGRLLNLMARANMPPREASTRNRGRASKMQNQSSHVKTPAMMRAKSVGTHGAKMVNGHERILSREASDTVIAPKAGGARKKKLRLRVPYGKNCSVRRNLMARP